MYLTEAINIINNYFNDNPVSKSLKITLYKEGLTPQIEQNELFLYYIKDEAGYGVGLLNLNTDDVPNEILKQLQTPKYLQKTGFELKSFNVNNLKKIFNDVLFLNKIFDVDVEKVFKGENNIKKENIINKRKIIKKELINFEKEIKFKEYLISRGIINFDKIKYYKIITKNDFGEEETGYYQPTTGPYSFAGYILKNNNFEKDKIGFDLPTIYKNNSNITIISEGQMDSFSYMKNNENLLINNGINISSSYIKNVKEIINKKNKILFLLDRDIAGLKHILNTFVKIDYSFYESFQKELKKLHYNIQLKIKKFINTDMFQNFLKEYQQYENTHPLKRKKLKINFQTYSTFNSNQVFQKHLKAGNFDFTVDKESINLNENYLLILLFQKQFKIPYNYFIEDEILKEYSNNIKQIIENKLKINIDIKYPKYGKDFNEELLFYLKELDNQINPDNTIFGKSNKKINILSNEEIKNIKQDNKIEYIKQLKKIIFSKDLFNKNLIINLNNQTEIKKEKTYENKALIYENKYMVYGIDETAMGNYAGPVIATITSADKKSIKNKLINDLNNDITFQNFINNIDNKQIKEKLKNIEININNISYKDLYFINKLNNVPKSLKNIYNFKLITDSKKLTRKQIKQINELINYLKENKLIKSKTIIKKCNEHKKVKQIQKEIFKELIQLPQPLTKEQKEKIQNSIEKRDKIIVIDGQNIGIDIKNNKIPIIFEPKADLNYFSVSLSSIIAKQEEINYIENISKKIETMIPNYLKNEEKEIINNYILNLRNSNAYGTENHINNLKKVIEINKKIPVIINYLKQVYRKNEIINELFNYIEEKTIIYNKKILSK